MIPPFSGARQSSGQRLDDRPACTGSAPVFMDKENKFMMHLNLMRSSKTISISKTTLLKNLKQ